MNDNPWYSLLLQQKGIPVSLSLGRVQTPTTSMIYQLQEKIKKSQEKPYFEGKAQIIA